LRGPHAGKVACVVYIGLYLQVAGTAAPVNNTKVVANGAYLGGYQAKLVGGGVVCFGKKQGTGGRVGMDGKAQGYRGAVANRLALRIAYYCLVINKLGRLCISTQHTEHTCSVAYQGAYVLQHSCFKHTVTFWF
jgi:hypothetical protein